MGSDLAVVDRSIQPRFGRRKNGGLRPLQKKSYLGDFGKKGTNISMYEMKALESQLTYLAGQKRRMKGQKQRPEEQALLEPLLSRRRLHPRRRRLQRTEVKRSGTRRLRVRFRRCR